MIYLIYLRCRLQTVYNLNYTPTTLGVRERKRLTTDCLCSMLSEPVMERQILSLLRWPMQYANRACNETPDTVSTPLAYAVC
jgi:hypothetical protein